MLATKSDLEASEPVLQAKVADFQRVLGFQTFPMPNPTVSRLFHVLRRFPFLFSPSRSLANRHRSGLLITFDVHTLKTQAPFFLCSGGDHALVLMDTWPVNFETVAKWSRQYRISNIFVSSQQACAELRAMAPELNWHWLPEGLPHDQYRPHAWEDKSIDVLSFGRKFDKLHEILKEGLPAAGVSYAYEPKPYEVLFPTQEEFLEGLGSARISVCFPSSVTHPQRSGHIETLTVRYLQSMASKCLIYGQSPAELRELFGYEPVVPVDWNNPVGQLSAILQDPSPYVDLVERNFATLHSAHTEIDRARKLAETMNWPTK